MEASIQTLTIKLTLRVMGFSVTKASVSMQMTPLSIDSLKTCNMHLWLIPHLLKGSHLNRYQLIKQLQDPLNRNHRNIRWSTSGEPLTEILLLLSIQVILNTRTLLLILNSSLLMLEMPIKERSESYSLSLIHQHLNLPQTSLLSLIPKTLRISFKV